MKKYCSNNENGWSCANIMYKDNLCAKHYRRKNNLQKQKFCSVDGCSKIKDCKGLCSGHYRRYKRQGVSFDRITPLRKQKPNRKIEDNWDYPVNGNCLVPRCNEKIELKGMCFSHYRWIKKHELTIFDIKDALQNGCESCGSLDNLTIDHDHSICPGKTVCKLCYRGILCRSCNLAEGYLNGDIDKIYSLANYIITKRKNI